VNHLRGQKGELIKPQYLHISFITEHRRWVSWFYHLPQKNHPIGKQSRLLNSHTCVCVGVWVREKRAKFIAQFPKNFSRNLLLVCCFTEGGCSERKALPLTHAHRVNMQISDIFANLIFASLALWYTI